MSYNDLIYRQLEASLLLKKELLEKYSETNKHIVKQKLLDLEEYKNELKYKNVKTSSLDQLFVENMSFLKEQIDFSHKEIMIKEMLLKDKINNYNSEIESKHLSTQGKLKQLRSKLNLLYGKKSKERFLIREDFLNFFNLNYSRTNSSNLNIDSECEVATLPIAEEKKVETNKIFISKESNCIPGNYLNGKNKYIYSIVDNNEDTVFEAFKAGEGPLVLSLVFKFKKEEIVNEVTVGQLPFSGSSNIEIENIHYSSNSDETFHLKQLINIDEQNLKMLSSNKKNLLKIKHIPVRASQAKVVLKVKEYSNVDEESVFLVGLKKVGFKSIKYKDTGEINSNVFNIPENYFEIFYEEKSFPNRKLTFNTELKVSTDNGGVFNAISDSETLLTDGRDKQLVYKYNVSKNRNAILKINEFLDDSYFVEVEAESSLINKNISPSKYEIPFSNIIRNSLKVVQPKVLSRSDSLSRRVKIGKIKNSGIETFVLETPLKDYNDDEIEIYINKKLCAKVEESELTTDLTWHLKLDKKTILVYTEKTQPILEVSLLLKPALPTLVKKPEGYYIPIKENFDYDKNTLKIMCITSLSEDKEENLPIGKERIFLNENYLDRNSVIIEEYNNDQWEEIDFETESSVTVNVLDGIVELDPSIIEKEHRINYRYYSTKMLEKKDYEIWVKDSKVKGLYIYPENISFEDKQDNLSQERSNRYYLFDGSYSEARSDISSNRAFILSNSNIIKGSLSVGESLFDDNFEEVEYVDGYSEFLNVEKMQKDYVPSLEKDTNGQVQFSLQEIPFVDGRFSSEVKAYNKEGIEQTVTVNGRIATLTVANEDTISRDYYVSYYYQSEERNSESYSVNYLDGILYTSKDVDETNVNVNYKVGRVGLEYYIYNEINNIEVDYNNLSIRVDTEEFFELSNNIKFLAFRTKGNVTLEGLEDYYSPIIYSLKVGLN